LGTLMYRTTLIVRGLRKHRIPNRTICSMLGTMRFHNKL